MGLAQGLAQDPAHGPAQGLAQTFDAQIISFIAQIKCSFMPNLLFIKIIIFPWEQILKELLPSSNAKNDPQKELYNICF